MDRNKAIALYSMMLKIRLVEEAIIEEYPSQEIRTPVHLYIGQEAIAAGVSFNLQPRDLVVSNHRSHGHCLAKGLDLNSFFKELYGRQGGTCGGQGGSMHIWDMHRGIVGTSAIIAGGIPIGAGVALSQKIQKRQAVTVIYFGDGAVDEGIFWETVNFSALKALPVLFVMEDNHYASQTSTEQRHAYSEIINIVQGYGVPALLVDGNDVLEVAEVSEGCINKIRAGNGPFFICCKTYRWKGHVGCSDDLEMGYRSAEEIELWKGRCPILRMENYLAKEYPGDIKRVIVSLRDRWQKEITKAINKAKEAPYAVD